MLFCDKEECKNRSKRPSKKYFRKDGEPLHRCKLKHIFIGEAWDLDGTNYSETSTCFCQYFSSKNSNKNKEEE